MSEQIFDSSPPEASLERFETTSPIACAPGGAFFGVVVVLLVNEQPASASATISEIGMNRTDESLRDLDLPALAARIEGCRTCPRLVAWREQVAHERRAAYATQTYWGRPVAGFGDPAARIVILGLAPAAHGANRTGRVFTGDRSGDFLYAALYRAGLASQPTSTARDDGLRLRDCFVTAAVRCAPPANRPTPAERDACLPYARRELELLPARVLVCLGAFAWDAALRICDERATPRPKFTHAAEWRSGVGLVLLGCYHPSQQNTFTGVLNATMMDAVLDRAIEIANVE